MSSARNRFSNILDNKNNQAYRHFCTISFTIKCHLNQAVSEDKTSKAKSKMTDVIRDFPFVDLPSIK